MHALELEPEDSGRWQRLGMGTLLSGVIATGLAFAAQRIEPVRHALASVVPIAVIEEPDVKPEEPEVEPPPPPPEPPAPKPSAQPKTAQAEPPPDAPPPPADAPPPSDQVGLDADSFGSGSGGPAFQVGTTQMGAPTKRYGSVRAKVDEPKAKAKRNIVEARPMSREFMRLPEWAAKKRIEGLMVIETEIDKAGRVVKTWVRSKLDPRLDAFVQKALLDTKFQPALLDGRPVSSTKYVRVRFVLE